MPFLCFIHTITTPTTTAKAYLSRFGFVRACGREENKKRKITIEYVWKWIKMKNKPYFSSQKMHWKAFAHRHVVFCVYMCVVFALIFSLFQSLFIFFCFIRISHTANSIYSTKRMAFLRVLLLLFSIAKRFTIFVFDARRWC